MLVVVKHKNVSNFTKYVILLPIIDDNVNISWCSFLRILAP